MEIMFDDLTEDAQKRLLDKAGVSKPEDMHWDEVPITVVEFHGDDYKIDADDFIEDIYDEDEPLY
ncbi:MAG: hypothetical protein ACYSR3_15330 [Planctomycetota bacterium]|jgi:hypothetical protein